MSNLRVDYATYESAKYSCEHWHYSGTIPSSKLFRLGVWEDDVFKGVVIFGYGANKNMVKKYGLDMIEACELVRIALKPHDAFVSEILSKSIKLLKETNPKLQLIISYADADQNHTGKIYQATNWIYEGMVLQGMSRAWIINGKKIHNRSVSTRCKSLGLKNRLDDIKIAYKTQYVEKHITKGKHKYLMPLNKKIRKLALKYGHSYP